MSEQPLQPTGSRPVSTVRAVASFLLAGLVVLAAVAVLLGVLEHRAAVGEAIRNARTLTDLEAASVVGPALTDSALQRGTPAAAALDDLVRHRVLGSHIVRVKIWDQTGRIRYSDAADLVGARFVLGGQELAALRSGRTVAEVTNLADAENRDERRFGKLVQVYLGVRTPTGQRLLFETYQPYTVIAQTSRRLLLISLPVLLAGLLLLYLVQAPLAYRMARRLKASQDEREGLLLSALAASDRERTSIAADLHDGIVQGLAGASFTLSAAAGRARDRDPTAAAVLATTATDLRRWVRELRSLVLTITPPALHAQGLAMSLADLAATLEVRGLTVTTEIADTADLTETTEALVYRAAQEAVRNIVRHAEAGQVSIQAHREQEDVFALRVLDDGRGLDADSGAPRRRGSVGLELLGSLVAAHGGSLTVGPGPAAGTELLMRLPVQPPAAVPAARPAPPSTPGSVAVPKPSPAGRSVRR